MQQIRIMMYDRESFVFKEYDVVTTLERIIFDYQNREYYLSVFKDDGNEFVLNKDYIMAMQIEEAD